MPFTHKDKSAGDVLKSQDWNAGMNEIARLESAKLNRLGSDKLQGPLTIEESIAIGKVDASSVATDGSRLKIALSEADLLDVRFSTIGAGQLEIAGGTNGWTINTKTDGKHLYLNRDANAASDVYIGRQGRELVVKGTDGNVSITNTLSVTGASSFNGLTTLQPTLTATANNAALTAVRINPTFVSNPSTLTGVKQNALIVESGNVGIGTSTPRSALDTGTGVMTGAANDYMKAQFALSGGGVVSWSWNSTNKNGRLKWTYRFIAISMERSTTFSEGHVSIGQPTTDIPAAQVYDATARSATADGVLLKEWEALYAVHTVGRGQAAVTFQIVHWQTASIAPSNWILVAVVNSDEQSIKLGTGVILNKQQEAWITPTFSGNWVNYSTDYNPAGYFKDSLGIVHLRGLVKSGTNTIFTLPVGYRPAYRELHAVQTNENTIGRIDILTTGEIQMMTGSSVWISLDGITFRAA